MCSVASQIRRADRIQQRDCPLAVLLKAEKTELFRRGFASCRAYQSESALLAIDVVQSWGITAHL